MHFTATLSRLPDGIESTRQEQRFVRSETYRENPFSEHSFKSRCESVTSELRWATWRSSFRVRSCSCPETRHASTTLSPGEADRDYVDSSSSPVSLGTLVQRQESSWGQAFTRDVNFALSVRHRISHDPLNRPGEDECRRAARFLVRACEQKLVQCHDITSPRHDQTRRLFNLSG